ncbi:MATE family efflux transporter [Ruminococcaceae bacterium OttesenSCG-928-A11]|nr:MATE family efflux transporter [Ruminococcaceae bacterium OttesenSCG-928-A11]
MSTPKNRASIDMTKGNAFGLLLRFSLPLIAGNALQQLYNMVDSVVVGQFVSHTALAAVGIAFPVIFLLASLFMGLGMGAMVMVSQFYGAGDKTNLRNTIDTVYTALLVGGIPLSVIGALLARPVLTLLNVPADTEAEAWLYLVIVLGGLLGSLGYNLNAGILQGIGDSRTPLLFLTIACLLNIVLDLLLVLVIPLGVAGVAIATIVAQFFSWIFGIFWINKKYPELTIRPFSFNFNKKLFVQIIRLGLPAGVQNALFSVGALMMTRLVNSFGSAFAAGWNAANKIDTFAFLPIQSITNAMMTYSGQNIGAGKLARVKHGTRASLLMCTVVALLGLLVMPIGPYLMRMFTDDPTVVDAGMAFIYRIMPFYWMLGINFSLNNTMRGAGEAMVPMISSLVGLWLARVPAAYLLAEHFGAANLNFCYAIGWVVGLCITIPYYLSGRWKNKSVTRAGNNPDAEAAAADRPDLDITASDEMPPS